MRTKLHEMQREVSRIKKARRVSLYRATNCRDEQRRGELYHHARVLDVQAEVLEKKFRRELEKVRNETMTRKSGNHNENAATVQGGTVSVTVSGQQWYVWCREDPEQYEFDNPEWQEINRGATWRKRGKGHQVEVSGRRATLKDIADAMRKMGESYVDFMQAEGRAAGRALIAGSRRIVEQLDQDNEGDEWRRECSDCGSRDCRYFGNCVYCHTDHRECEGCNEMSARYDA